MNALSTAPGETYKYSVQRLWVVSSCQLARRLHVALEVPVSLQTNAADVDDICAESDGCARVLTVGELGAQRLGKARQVLIKGKQTHELGGCFGIVCGARVGGCDRLFVGIDGLGVEVADLKEVDGNAALVATAGPLGVEATALLVRFDIDRVVENVEINVGAPFLRVFKLGACIGYDPAAGAQEAQQDGIVVGGRRARLVETGRG